MKFNKLFIIIAMFVLTGCSATYNVELKNGIVKESLQVDNIDVSNQMEDYFVKFPLSVSTKDSCFLDYDYEVLKNAVESNNYEKDERIKYYSKIVDGNTLKYRTNMALYKYQDSRIANALFNNMHVNNYTDLISFYGFNGFLAFNVFPNLDKVTVNITVDRVVTEHNADKVSGNKYTWYFDKNTKDDKTLLIRMNNKKYTKQSFGDVINDNIFLVILLVVIIVLGIVLLIRKHMNNKPI